MDMLPNTVQIGTKGIALQLASREKQVVVSGFFEPVQGATLAQVLSTSLTKRSDVHVTSYWVLSGGGNACSVRRGVCEPIGCEARLTEKFYSERSAQ